MEQTVGIGGRHIKDPHNCNSPSISHHMPFPKTILVEWYIDEGVA